MFNDTVRELGKYFATGAVLLVGWIGFVGISQAVEPTEISTVICTVQGQYRSVTATGRGQDGSSGTQPEVHTDCGNFLIEGAGTGSPDERNELLDQYEIGETYEFQIYGNNFQPAKIYPTVKSGTKLR
ncbi:hypothetical protein ACFVAJ_18195 [Agromyces sp. NPDC057679]|uniref:hypothetical protein n=1 Tax=Agromyces sp. NPDC057679 TaxID=3346207 RepID=UPI00366E38C5